MKDEIPTWLFFSLYDCRALGKNWNEEKEKLAHHIMASIKRTAEFYHWPEEVLKNAFHFNKHDDCNMYGSHQPIKK